MWGAIPQKVGSKYPESGYRLPTFAGGGWSAVIGVYFAAGRVILAK